MARPAATGNRSTSGGSRIVRRDGGGRPGRRFDYLEQGPAARKAAQPPHPPAHWAKSEYAPRALRNPVSLAIELARPLASRAFPQSAKRGARRQRVKSSGRLIAE